MYQEQEEKSQGNVNASGERNRVVLSEKIKHAGLATEYSDATAVVNNSVRRNTPC